MPLSIFCAVARRSRITSRFASCFSFGFFATRCHLSFVVTCASTFRFLSILVLFFFSRVLFSFIATRFRMCLRVYRSTKNNTSSRLASSAVSMGKQGRAGLVVKKRRERSFVLCAILLLPFFLRDSLINRRPPAFFFVAPTTTHTNRARTTFSTRIPFSPATPFSAISFLIYFPL